MNNSKRMLSALEALGKRSFEQYLSEEKRHLSQLRDNWFDAFKFVLSRLYSQGRSDSLSRRYLDAMIECLDKCFLRDGDPAANLRTFWERSDIPHRAQWWVADAEQDRFQIEKSALWLRFDGTMGKARDREMVLDVLRYVHTIEGHNVVRKTIEQVNAGRIRQHRDELMKLRSVGHKTSAFYLRELVWLFGLEPALKDVIHILPIDTWVRQVVAALSRHSRDGKGSSPEEWFAQNCRDTRQAMLVNAGMWYMGTHSFELMLALLADGSICPEALERITLDEPVKGNHISWLRTTLI